MADREHSFVPLIKTIHSLNARVGSGANEASLLGNGPSLGEETLGRAVFRVRASASSAPVRE